jgi:hypothetical protein
MKYKLKSCHEKIEEVGRTIFDMRVETMGPLR